MVKLVLTDIDGVWTDGSMYYTDTGYEMKRFNTYDSAGVLLLKQRGIPLAIITGETSESVRLRAQKLNISNIRMGIKDKLACAIEIEKEMSIALNEMAYIGDDIYDIPLLKSVGLSACPRNAPSYVKKIVDHVLAVNGGDGAFRDFVERYILGKSVVLETIYEILEPLRVNLH